MVSSGFVCRVASLLMVALQSPFMMTSSGAGVAPISLLTKYVVEASMKNGGELTEQARSGLRALNWPAHMFEECVMRRVAGLEGNCDATFVWERAISHATKGVTLWGSLPEQAKQVLFAGCATFTFGTVMSFVAGRTHLLSVLGSGILGYGMYINFLTPTFQFVVCALLALLGMRARGKTAITAATPSAKPAAPIKAAAKADVKGEPKKTK
ncbi:hypothetical protein T492DRAFT_1030475 [Pavlovales sp. CCMP2436]|nr:hypothetical protein T492DRAFT_1030475 [Pavlovales sp. CCMP2436]